MKIRNILIALVIVAVGVCGAVTMSSGPGSKSGETSLVTNRPLGVAYAQDGGGGTPPPAAGDAADAAVPPAAELTDEEWLAKLDEWKNSDPRAIVEKKYDDLNSRQTNPSDEDDPENFIPETGRVDPLTPVSGAIPKELMPPRTGDTDANEVESYIDAAVATAVVDEIGRSIEVYNVIQIGLRKIVSITFFGGSTAIDQGDPYRFTFGGPEGYPVRVTFSCISASSDEVVISVQAVPQGSNISITKNFSYIPR